jgi:hypothetical protein
MFSILPSHVIENIYDQAIALDRAWAATTLPCINKTSKGMYYEILKTMRLTVTSEADRDHAIRMIDASPNLTELNLQYTENGGYGSDDDISFLEIPLSARSLHTLTIESWECKLTHSCSPNLKALAAVLGSDNGSRLSGIPSTLEYASVNIIGDGENIFDLDETFGHCTGVLDIKLVDAVKLSKMVSKMHHLEVLKIDNIDTEHLQDFDTPLDLMHCTALGSFAYIDEESDFEGYTIRLPPSLETLYVAFGHKVEFPEGCPILTAVCMDATTHTMVSYDPSEWRAMWAKVQIAVLALGPATEIIDLDTESPLEDYLLPGDSEMTLYLILQSRDHYDEASLRGIAAFANRTADIVLLYEYSPYHEELAGDAIALIRRLCPRARLYQGSVPLESQEIKWALVMTDMPKIPYIHDRVVCTEVPHFQYIS